MLKVEQDLYNKVELSLDSIRPYLKADGGDIEVVEITDDGVVKVRLLGACESCPMSFMTMKAGVEESIRSAIPGIKGVETVTSLQ
jgi:Fe-S cluster biogenesis protein NfuA